MKKRVPLVGLFALITLLAIALATRVVAQGGTDSQPDGKLVQPSAPIPATAGADSNPTGAPEVIIPPPYQSSLPNAPDAPTATVTTVYFTPQDENTSTTELFLYNTNTTTATVGLQTFYIDGSLTISTSISIPPLGLVRVSADSVSTISASWQNVVLVNFTTFSAYAKMTVPQGVKYEGYVAWDITGVYNPLSSTVTLPLRFSTDATAAIQTSTVYFTPQDENTSTTELFLFNTNTTTATVGLQTFYINGSLTISTSVSIPPLGLTRVSADSVSTVSVSWQNVVLVNFTTFSAYARLTVPHGVMYDGYVAWDTTGVYDPLVPYQTLPLRFSTEPAMILLPTIQR
jgi:hypothetical protein